MKNEGGMSVSENTIIKDSSANNKNIFVILAFVAVILAFVAFLVINENFKNENFELLLTFVKDLILKIVSNFL